MLRTLLTIGYEGAEIGQFLSTLEACHVRTVIDVRDVPVSRKRGFSKSALSKVLEERGIGYRHLKALGDPKPGRDAMRRGDYPAFLEVYSRHLATTAAQEALSEAVELASEGTAVLLCFERSPKECHRMLVAAEMEEMAGFEVRNIGVNPLVALGKAPAACPSRLAELAR